MKSNSFCFLRNIAVFITNESYVHKLHYLDFFFNLYAPFKGLKVTLQHKIKYKTQHTNQTIKSLKAIPNLKDFI